ncbi:MAG: polyphenol oxidase family protein [Actinomycetota bacterium]|jgi:YfiH family protein|nr:laccase domain-containing protein [Solirubrobacterales bacterium]MBA3861910.1 laccase domain-containing protein [Solirubrobacterales bacterium]MDQ3409815.1 polyphenol oxidase family protein [Actinomycetota bacterium]
MNSPFAWRGDHLAADFGSARVLFTTRAGGVSGGPYASLNLGTSTDDDPAKVSENRERLTQLTGAGLALGRQVHEAHIHRADAPGHAGDADGQATTSRGIACTVLTADCLPVAVIAPGGVAMLHAGWRGLAASVLEEGVAALRVAGEGESDGLVAAIGPGAGRCCYEVGDEVRAAFADEGEDVRAGRNLDLPLIAERRLRRSGVTEVHQTGLCTMCDPRERFFSHRRDGGVTGRQAGVAWLI